MISPALIEAKSPFFRPIKHSLFPPLGLAQIEAGYWRAYRDFYRWGSIFRGPATKVRWSDRARPVAYAGGWNTLEPMWDAVNRAQRATSMLPVLEEILSGFGRYRPWGEIEGVSADGDEDAAADQDRAAGQHERGYPTHGGRCAELHPAGGRHRPGHDAADRCDQDDARRRGPEGDDEAASACPPPLALAPLAWCLMGTGNAGACADTLTTETRPLACVAFMLIQDECVLLQRRSHTKRVVPGVLAVPGGHIEGTESPEEAVRRELRAHRVPALCSSR
jgi:hypothetical protein